MDKYEYDENFLDVVEDMCPSEIVGTLVNEKRFNWLVEETGLDPNEVAENLNSYKRDPEGLAKRFYNLGGKYGEHFSEVLNEMIDVQNRYNYAMDEEYYEYCGGEDTFFTTFNELIREKPVYLYNLIVSREFEGTNEWEYVQEIIDENEIDDEVDLLNSIEEIAESIDTYELRDALYTTFEGKEIRDAIEYKIAYDDKNLENFLNEFCANMEFTIELDKEKDLER